MRGLALMSFIGTSSLLLLLAAGLLTQLFAHRSVAFAGVLALIVLYVAALDRAVLNAHLDRLADTDATIPTRLIACTQAGHTFFYRDTCRRKVQSIAAANDSPEKLRKLMQQLLDAMEDFD